MAARRPLVERLPLVEHDGHPGLRGPARSLWAAGPTATCWEEGLVSPREGWESSRGKSPAPIARVDRSISQQAFLQNAHRAPHPAELSPESTDPGPRGFQHALDVTGDQSARGRSSRTRVRLLASTVPTPILRLSLSLEKAFARRRLSRKCSPRPSSAPRAASRAAGIADRPSPALPRPGRA